MQYFTSLKLELLIQSPVSNEEKYLQLWKNKHVDVFNFELIQYWIIGLTKHLQKTIYQIYYLVLFILIYNMPGTVYI